MYIEIDHNHKIFLHIFEILKVVNKCVIHARFYKIVETGKFLTALFVCLFE